MLGIDLTGKRAFVAGVSDDGGFGFAIAKALAEAGAKVSVGTWPPTLGIFTKLLERGKMAESLVLKRGGVLEFEKIYPFDADFDTYEDMPAEIRENKRYKDHGDVSIQACVEKFKKDFAGDTHPLDIIVHSLANGPEVKKPLLQTSRKGYLAAIGASSYSFTSMVQRFSPIVKPGGSFVGLTYMASERVVPGYGGGMSSAKAALESDMRVLSYEAGREWGHRVNVISAGPFASRAASAIGYIKIMIDYCKENSPVQQSIEAEDVGHTAAFLASPLGAGITGTVVYVDKGYHSMGMATDRAGLIEAKK